jgi:kinetochore protein Mis13/DSN1
VRRSKRLSRDHEERDASPVPKPITKAKQKQQINISGEQPKHVPIQSKEHSSKAARPEVRAPAQAQTPPESQPEVVPVPQEDHPATKIALPFADTPVIKRNKAMREGKGGKGERRSSLGLRGRRASSLIETGNSNGEVRRLLLKCDRLTGW